MLTISHEDVAQEAEVRRLEQPDRPVSKRLVRYRLEEKWNHQGAARMQQATTAQLAAAPDSRTDALDALRELQGLPPRVLAVAEFLAAGWSDGETRRLLMIDRRELERCRKVLLEVLLG